MPSRSASNEVSEAEVVEALEGCATAFEARADDLAEALADHLMREVPELGTDPGLRAEWLASHRANIRAWLVMVRDGASPSDVRPPQDALDVARTYVLRGAPLPVLLRVYRLGHAFVVDRWIDALRARDDAPAFFDVLVRRSLQVSFAYVDAMSAHVAETYALERANAVRSSDLARAETTRAILAGEAVDVGRASAALGYALRRRHVALVAWADGGDERDSPLARLEAAVGEVARELDADRPLVVPAGRRLVWAWCAVGRDGVEALDGSRRTDGVSIAVGQPAEGADGFVCSHQEALEAHRVAVVAGRPPGAVVRYRDVDLLSLLTGDLPRARRYAASELGSLAVDDDTTLRLRATLKVYLEEQHSFAAAARRLGVHENTVKYRVRQCEDLLGRPVGARPLKLLTALTLVDALGLDS